MVSSPFRGSNRPTNTMFWWSAPISSGTGSAAGVNRSVSMPLGMTW